jgi:ubiquinone/menaquinone biosynthesis C-methylase UbiE
MDLLPRHHEDFRRKEYWDEFFKKRQEKAFEWYGQYAALRPALCNVVKPKDRILVVGCGNSDLSPQWAQDGYKNVVSMDFSELVIKEMRAKHPKMKWDVMDMTQMTYADESFDCVMDKGALDALRATDEVSVLADALKMFHEVDRVLARGGSYICVTMVLS